MPKKTPSTFRSQNPDLPVWVGNGQIIVWTRPRPSGSGLELCLTVRDGAKKQDLKDAMQDILAWREQLTAFQGGHDTTPHAFLLAELRRWKKEGLTQGQMVNRLRNSISSAIRGYQDKTNSLYPLEEIYVYGVFRAFGLSDKDIGSTFDQAMTNLRNDLPAFGKPITHGHRRRQYPPDDFPITVEMMKTFLRHGRKKDK